MLHDINTQEDVTKLVDTFYAAVLSDALLAPFFSRIDFDHHKPRMVHFWSFVLFDEPGYTTNIFDKHANMALTRDALQQWVLLFELTARQHFSGEKTEQAVLRAKTIAWTFQEKMNLS
jgi:hemoglobin